MHRRQKLFIAMGVIAASALLISFNTTAQAGPKAMGVAEAKQDHLLLAGRPVSVRGVVENVTTNGTMVDTFILSEGGEKLLVKFGQPPPDNFGPAKDVVVYGTLVDDSASGPSGGFAAHLEATSIQVGCSSKY